MMVDIRGKTVWGPTPEEYVIKQPSDWRVLNYINKCLVENLSPAYEQAERAKKELGVQSVQVKARTGKRGGTGWLWHLPRAESEH